MIGSWCARFADDGHGRQITKWHYVESTIERRQITHCGKQLDEREGTVLAPVQSPPKLADACERCLPVLA